MASELWRWQGGTSGNLYGAAAGDDGTVVLTGRTDGDWEGTNAGGYDVVAVKFDADGAELWRWQGGTNGDEAGNEATTATGDGSTVLVGSTTGDWGAANAGESDFVAVKLDSDGTPLWIWQNGTVADEVMVGVTESSSSSSSSTSDGDMILAGRTQGNWSGSSAGGADFCAVKLTAGGTELWRWQGGTTKEDYIKSGSMVDLDDSVVLAGYTGGVWSVTNAGGYDLAAMKLDAADGGLLWRWQDGTEEDDFVSEGVTGTDGSIVLAGYSFGDWNATNAGEEDFVAVKIDTDGTELWRWQEGSPESDKIFSATILEDDSVVLTGYTRGDWAQTNAGGSDFCAVKLHSNGTVLWRWQDGTEGDDWVTGTVAATTTRVLLAGTTEGIWSATADTTSGISTSTATSTSEDLAVIALDADTVNPVILPTSAPSSALLSAPTPAPTTSPPTITPTLASSLAQQVNTPNPSFMPLSPSPTEGRSSLADYTSEPGGDNASPSPTEAPQQPGSGTSSVATAVGIGVAAAVCLCGLAALMIRTLFVRWGYIIVIGGKNKKSKTHDGEEAQGQASGGGEGRGRGVGRMSSSEIEMVVESTVGVEKGNPPKTHDVEEAQRVTTGRGGRGGGIGRMNSSEVRMVAGSSVGMADVWPASSAPPGTTPPPY